MITKQIKEIRIIPVLTIQDVSDTIPVAEALIEGGLPCAEVTLRSDAGLAAIQALSKRSDILVGAGTVLSPEKAQAARDAGAKFIVSPGFNPKTVSWCLENDVPVYPGTANPTDMEMALDFGLKTVKFFPAEAFGGIKTIKAIGAAYNMLTFIPTGGINPGNVADYLSNPQVIACGGSWMIKPEWIQEKNYQSIVQETKKTVDTIQNL